MILFKYLFYYSVPYFDVDFDFDCWGPLISIPVNVNHLTLNVVLYCTYLCMS